MKQEVFLLVFTLFWTVSKIHSHPKNVEDSTETVEESSSQQTVLSRKLELISSQLDVKDESENAEERLIGVRHIVKSTARSISTFSIKITKTKEKANDIMIHGREGSEEEEEPDEDEYEESPKKKKKKSSKKNKKKSKSKKKKSKKTTTADDYYTTDDSSTTSLPTEFIDTSSDEDDNIMNPFLNNFYPSYYDPKHPSLNDKDPNYYYSNNTCKSSSSSQFLLHSHSPIGFFPNYYDPYFSHVISYTDLYYSFQHCYYDSKMNYKINNFAGKKPLDPIFFNSMSAKN